MILQLAIGAAAPTTPEQEEAEIVEEPVAEPSPLPGHDLYAAATLTTSLNCVPECNVPWVKRVFPGKEVIWRWSIGPNPHAEGTQHANVMAYWCWKSQPEDQCLDEASRFLDYPFNVEIGSGQTGVRAWFDKLAWLWRGLTFGGPVPWLVLIAWYVFKPPPDKLAGLRRRLRELVLGPRQE
ncbi:MAG: hypothetical protein WBF66_07335 [Dehalococcoidia bacterium]